MQARQGAMADDSRRGLPCRADESVPLAEGEASLGVLERQPLGNGDKVLIVL
jgi:hypothetical protein